MKIHKGDMVIVIYWYYVVYIGLVFYCWVRFGLVFIVMDCYCLEFI